MTRTEAMKAKCRDCMADYADGRRDCENPACALYHWMPYRAGRRSEPKPERSAAQQAASLALAARMRSERQKQGVLAKSQS